MDILQLFFNYKGFSHLRLDGNTKSEERADRMALFNEKNSPFDIFLLSTRAGGLGLNL
jgi:SNF2 family DNA or RNA helicase